MDKITYVFDIDETICHTEGSDYDNSQPIIKRIEAVNKLYDEGHTVLFLTARGMGRNKNDQQASITEFYDFTFNQLKMWGVKFHQLFLGKPAGDIYIDDKGYKDTDFFDD